MQGDRTCTAPIGRADAGGDRGVCDAHGDAWIPVGDAEKRDIRSRFVAPECSQGLDVQLNRLEARAWRTHAIRLFR
jgi:hypothetical protein